MNVVADAVVTTNLTQFSKGIYISSSVGSGNVGTKLTFAPVGIYNAEKFLQDELLFTGNIDTFDFGSVPGQTNAVILDAASPLAGGLSGTVLVANSPLDLLWGAPTNAVEAAGTDDAYNDAIIYGYETNAVLYDGITPAPARRVNTFYQGAFLGVEREWAEAVRRGAVLDPRRSLTGQPSDSDHHLAHAGSILPGRQYPPYRDGE